MMNTVAWLTKRTTFTNLKIVTAHLPGTETYWFPHETRPAPGSSLSTPASSSTA